jgi:hypothetical protein
MQYPLCTLINNSNSFFYSVFLQHCKTDTFTDSDKFVITTHFLGVHFDVDAIYIGNKATITELIHAVKNTIRTLSEYKPRNNVRVYVHWPDFGVLNNVLCTIAETTANDLVYVKCMQPKMLSVAYNCLNSALVTPLLLCAMFDCYHFKHLKV